MPNARSRYADLTADGTPDAPYGGVTGGRVNPAVQPGVQTSPATGPFVPGTQPTHPAPLPSGTTWQDPGGWTSAASVGGPEQFGGNYEQWFRALVGDRPWNQQTLNNLMPVLSHYGINLTPANANGDQTKIQLPTGEWVRVGFGEGKPVWIPQTNAQGQSLFSGQGSAPGMGGSGNQWSAMAGELGGPPPFEMPSMEQLQASPGYQARMDMGQQALERGAAAKGSLLSGGFQKTLNRYGQDYASNEYGKLFDQYLTRYNTNVGTQSQLPWSRYHDLLQIGSGATGTLGAAGKVPLPQG